MDAQQQVQQLRTPKKHKKRLTRRTIIIVGIIVATILSTAWTLSGLNVISSMWAIIVSVPVTVFGVLFTFLALIPADDKSTPPTPSTSSSIPSPQPDKPTHRGIASLPPPSDPKTIQQREATVRAVYTMLTKADITAIALTGIGGAGKSTLAALIYRYVETQRLAGKASFTAPSLWLRIDLSVILADILANLCEALNVPTPDLSTLSPQNQAVALFNMLDNAGKGRLVVLDQFENLLDNDGHVLTDRPGIGEWLDALNSQPCACRILLTSRPDPQGTRDDPPTCLQPYHVPGLAEVEGIDLLRKRNVQADEADMRTAVRRCDGHALSLTLLASLLQKRNLSLATLLNDPHYIQLWRGDIAQRLLDAIYEDQLDDIERKLLASFSIYREPVALDAAQAIMNEPTRMLKFWKKPTRIPEGQVQEALEGLLTQHLLQATGEGRYQVHAVVAAYARDHMVYDSTNEKQANQRALLAVHDSAAQYYLQQAKTSCPPREKRRKVNDVRDLVEAIWQYCQAEQWQKAYDLMVREGISTDVERWGGNGILLELYQLLLSDKWQPERSQAGIIYNNLGAVCNDLGEKEKALSYLEQALHIRREVGDRRGEGVTLSNLGKVYRAQGEKEKALSYLEQALRIRREIGDRRGEGVALNNLGAVYRDLGENKKVLWYLEQALRIHREVGNSVEEAVTLNNLGGAYNDLGEKEKALLYFEQALRIRREVGAHAGEGTTLWNIGAFYFDRERYNVAQACFLLARNIFGEVQSPDRDKVQRWIDNLRKKVGEEQFKALLAEVEPQSAQIVERALREDVVWDGGNS